MTAYHSFITTEAAQYKIHTSVNTVRSGTRAHSIQTCSQWLKLTASSQIKYMNHSWTRLEKWYQTDLLILTLLVYPGDIWNSLHVLVLRRVSELMRRDWKRETWHRETIEIVEADIARLDNSAPYRKGGHREACFIVRVEAQYKLIFAAGSIIRAAHRLYVCSFT